MSRSSWALERLKTSNSPPPPSRDGAQGRSSGNEACTLLTQIKRRCAVGHGSKEVSIRLRVATVRSLEHGEGLAQLDADSQKFSNVILRFGSGLYSVRAETVNGAVSGVLSGTMGKIYLETHQVIPLSEDGPDKLSNVVALCANHHRQAHFGESRKKIRKALRDRLRRPEAR